MAAQAVNGDQYRTIDRKMREIKRQLDQEGGYPFDLDELDKHLQVAIEGRFDRPSPAVYEGHTTLEQAAQIMGADFHGPAVVKKHLDIKLGRQKLFQSVPFSAEELRVCADTHVLVAAPAMSIMDIHGKASSAFYSSSDPWYGETEQKFAHEKIEPGWYLVRKDEIPNSTSRRWEVQQTMVVAPAEFVPAANLAVYAWILHYLATEERMFSRVWVRTNSVTAGGVRVGLDGGVDGLCVDGWRGYADSGVGVVSARKFG